MVVKFTEPLWPEQQRWLRATAVRMRGINFYCTDAASAALLQDTSTLVSGSAPVDGSAMVGVG